MRGRQSHLPEPRVLLRSPAAGDREEFLEAMRASRNLHRPWLDPPTTDDAFEALLRRVTEDFFEPLFVVRRRDGALLGFFNLSWIIRGPLQSAFLGYGAVAAHAGQGYMTEGMELTLLRAFVEMNLHRIEVNIQPGNAASIALAQRCGLKREGYSVRYLKVGGAWRDHERWAITVEDWRARPRRAGRRAGA
jgi:[ribosomal protein S5]-alanine N-acetyltransferase